MFSKLFGALNKIKYKSIAIWIFTSSASNDFEILIASVVSDCLVLKISHRFIQFSDAGNLHFNAVDVKWLVVKQMKIDLCLT